MSWKTKLGKLKARELGVIEVRILTDPGLKDLLDEAKAKLDAQPDSLEAQGNVAAAEREVESATLLFRFKTLSADCMERLRSEALKDSGDIDLEKLMVLIMVEAYIPENGEARITEDDIADLKAALTDQEWKQLYGAVITSSATSSLSWEKLGKG